MARTYVTSQGDTPDAIALRLWGNETLFHHLVEANPEIRGAVFLPAGLELTVPDVDDTAKTINPPWA